MPRYRLLIEYDGAAFSGWQAQANGPSVQNAIQDAVHSLSATRPEVVGAGRTDAGVHARGQVAHVDLPKPYGAQVVMDALNAYLKLADKPIVILDAQETTDDFHARFSATRRHYFYRIVNRRAPLAIDRDRAWHVIKPLDAALMHVAAQRLLGRHDFTSFRAAACQAKSPIKTLDFLSVERVGDEIHVRAHARSFLHNQVRAMTGTLKLVGEGRWTPDYMPRILAARDRQAAGPNAPPEGLYLTQVDYD